jgi:uncharacterized protein YutD
LKGRHKINTSRNLSTVLDFCITFTPAAYAWFVIRRAAGNMKRKSKKEEERQRLQTLQAFLALHNLDICTTAATLGAIAT